jgi:hypothetical protein
VEYEGKTEMGIWNGTVPVSGTDGTQFKPSLKKSELLNVFVDNLLRPTLFSYVDTVKLYGIDLYRYELG